MISLPKEFELTDYGESYASDLVEGKMTDKELGTKHRMGLIEPSGQLSPAAKTIMFLYNNDYEELYNSIDVTSAKEVKELYDLLNGLITLGLAKGDWWQDPDRVGPGKGQLVDERRAGFIPGVFRYYDEN